MATEQPDPRRRPNSRHLVFLVAVFAVLGTGMTLWHLRVRSTTFLTDGDTIRRRESLAAPRDVLWRPAERLTEGVNTPAVDEFEPRLSADGLTLWFVRGKAGQNADLFVSTRTPDGWSAPGPVAALNTSADELGPEPSADGETIYFYSNRAGGAGGYDLWASRRGPDGWEPAFNLGVSVNTGYNEYGPALTPSGNAIIFSTNRPRPDEDASPVPDAWPATVREDRTRHDYDLYRAPITGSGLGTATPIIALNTRHDEGTPAISPVGDFIYFCSDRPGGRGGLDIYRARIRGGRYDEPESVGPAINTAAHDLDPDVGMGGFGLHFSSDRPRAAHDDAALSPIDEAVAVAVIPDYDVFHTTSREVYADAETSRASIDWGALLPLLLWALLALLLVLLLWLLSRVLRMDRFRKLGLLAKCLVASVLAHMLLLFLMTLWGVGSSFSEWMQDGAGTQIVIVSPTVGDSLARQIRGELTELALETPREALERLESTPALMPLAMPATFEVERVTIEPENTPPARAEADDAPARVNERAPTTEIDVDDARAVTLDTPDVPTARRTEERRAEIETPRDTEVERARPEDSFEAARPDADLHPERLADPEPLPLPTVATAVVDAPSPTGARLHMPTATPELVLPPPAPLPFAALPALEESKPVPPPPEATDAGLMPATDLPTAERAALPLAQRTQRETPPTPIVRATPAAAAARERDESLATPAVLPMPTPTRTRLDLPSLAAPHAQEPEMIAFDLDLPEDLAPTPNPYEQRAPEIREKLVEEMGGSRETEAAVTRSLRWLARHQADDGRWSGRDYDDECGECSGRARVDVDIALTGLSTLCFLAANHTHMKDGPYRDVVTDAVEWLLQRQRPDGNVMGRESMYSHGIATIALTEAYAMTRDPRLREPVEKAIAFIVAARNRKTGGWRYAPRQAGDTSVLGWQIMALKSAARAGIDVPDTGFDVARAWMPKVESRPGRYAYQPGKPATPPMTAEGMFVQQLLGRTPEEPIMAASADYLMKNLPNWERKANTYYWYYATLAMFQHGGDAWSTWNARLKSELIDHQETEDEAAGSWKPNDNWSRTAGRVYQTAICTLTLEVYYRYLPSFVDERDEPAASE